MPSRLLPLASLLLASATSAQPPPRLEARAAQAIVAGCVTHSKARNQSHAIAVLVTMEGGTEGLETGGNISIGLTDAGGSIVREARLLGGREWVRLGAVELGLDCLRRRLLGLPIDERLDFERR